MPPPPSAGPSRDSAISASNAESTAYGAQVDSTDVLFILDASGSMWGRIAGETPKIVAARQVMQDLIRDLPDDSRVGLVAYGHRRKGDCGDVEVLRGLGPLDRQAMASHLETIDPKGKTPLAASVRTAVDDLRRREAASTVVLISDGLETCGGDPCAAVREARQAGVELRMHVVGFDVDEAEAGPLRCMAEAGGGRYFTAGDAEELGAALDTAVDTDSGTLVVGVTAEGEPVEAAIDIFPDGADERSAYAETRAGSDGNPARVELSPGTYDLEVDTGAIAGDSTRRLEDVVVESGGETTRRIEYGKGELAVTVVINDERAASGMDVFPAGHDTRIAYDETYAARDNPVVISLPAGEYALEVWPDPDRMDGVERRRVEGIRVAAGERVERRIAFEEAELRVEVLANGERAEGAMDVFRAGEDSRVAYEEVGPDAESNPAVLRLPPGDYAVEAWLDDMDAPARSRVDGLELERGASESVRVDIARGRLAVRVRSSAADEAAMNVFPQGADSRVAYSTASTTAGAEPALFHLPPGTYEVEVWDDAGQRQRLRGVEVQADRLAERTVDLDSAGS